MNEFQNLAHIIIFVVCVSGVIVALFFLWRAKSHASQLASDKLVAQQEYSQVLDEKTQALLIKDAELIRLQFTVEQNQLRAEEYRAQIVELTKIKEEYIEIKARFKEKERQAQAQDKLITEAKEGLLKEFELAAGKLFDAKQQNFQQASKLNLENVLNPFRQQLQHFHKQVEDVYYKESTQRNQLIGQIGELQKQAKKISEDANNLAHALKGDNKAQGQWGEIILERLLEQSGLMKGREYEIQGSYKNEEGKILRPDVLVHLPEKKDIVIDSKVALVHYERFVSEDDPLKKLQFLKAHVDAIRTHIKALSLKRYERLEGIQTLDFVFMFIPIEAAYVSAIQDCPTLFKEAHDKNIMLASPSSLMVALRTVEAIWRIEKQNKNTEKIADSAGKLYDQFVLVVTALEDLGVHLKRADDSYELVFNRLTSGRGNVLKRIERLKHLGAKASKTLPKSTRARLDDGLSLDDNLSLDENLDNVDEMWDRADLTD